MRDLFVLDPDLVFLNHGSFGACPKAVLEDQRRWQLEMERNPVDFLGRRSAELLSDARMTLGASLGARADDLIFVPNSTTGVNIVAQSFLLRPGDEVLATDHEYGACDAAWLHVCAKRGASYRRVEIPLPYDREGVVDRLMAAVSPRTRLIYVSHISSTTALIVPVAKICGAARARGITTLVDGAHAPGQIAVDLDAIGADFYVGNCHKWLCAPKGAGFLHARPEHHALLDATVISWGYAEGTGGHSGFDAYLGRTLFERRLQWQGTRDISPWLSVPAALRFQDRLDWPTVRSRCHELALHALAELAQRHGLQAVAEDEDWAQMVVIPVPVQDPETLRIRLLQESRIEIPVTTHGPRVFVRLSVQGYNSFSDIEHLLAAPALQ
jgi:isopenicillin-N epimerase